MTYGKENLCLSIVMIRFREIASVRLPGNRFRRRHMSPKGIRPGTWSRRWTVNLVTAGGARRAITFKKLLFVVLNFKNIKFQNFQKNEYIPKPKLKMFETYPEVRENWNLRKKISALIWDFRISISAIYIRIAKRILHLPLELQRISKNISKIKVVLFQKVSAIEVWDYSFLEAKDQWGYI